MTCISLYLEEKLKSILMSGSYSEVVKKEELNNLSPEDFLDHIFDTGLKAIQTTRGVSKKSVKILKQMNTSFFSALQLPKKVKKEDGYQPCYGHFLYLSHPIDLLTDDPKYLLRIAGEVLKLGEYRFVKMNDNDSDGPDEFIYVVKCVPKDCAKKFLASGQNHSCDNCSSLSLKMKKKMDKLIEILEDEKACLSVLIGPRSRYWYSTLFKEEVKRRYDFFRRISDGNLEMGASLPERTKYFRIFEEISEVNSKYRFSLVRSSTTGRPPFSRSSNLKSSTKEEIETLYPEDKKLFNEQKRELGELLRSFLAFFRDRNFFHEIVLEEFLSMIPNYSSSSSTPEDGKLEKPFNIVFNTKKDLVIYKMANHLTKSQWKGMQSKGAPSYPVVNESNKKIIEELGEKKELFLVENGIISPMDKVLRKMFSLGKFLEVVHVSLSKLAITEMEMRRIENRELQNIFRKGNLRQFRIYRNKEREVIGELESPIIYAKDGAPHKMEGIDVSLNNLPNMYSPSSIDAANICIWDSKAPYSFRNNRNFLVVCGEWGYSDWKKYSQVFRESIQDPISSMKITLDLNSPKQEMLNRHFEPLRSDLKNYCSNVNYALDLVDNIDKIVLKFVPKKSGDLVDAIKEFNPPNQTPTWSPRVFLEAAKIYSIYTLQFEEYDSALFNFFCIERGSNERFKNGKFIFRGKWEFLKDGLLNLDCISQREECHGHFINSVACRYLPEKFLPFFKRYLALTLFPGDDEGGKRLEVIILIGAFYKKYGVVAPNRLTWDNWETCKDHRFANSIWEILMKCHHDRDSKTHMERVRKEFQEFKHQLQIIVDVCESFSDSSLRDKCDNMGEFVEHRNFIVNRLLCLDKYDLLLCSQSNSGSSKEGKLLPEFYPKYNPGMKITTAIDSKMQVILFKMQAFEKGNNVMQGRSNFTNKFRDNFGVMNIQLPDLLTGKMERIDNIQNTARQLFLDMMFTFSGEKNSLYNDVDTELIFEYDHDDNNSTSDGSSGVVSRDARIDTMIDEGEGSHIEEEEEEDGEEMISQQEKQHQLPKKPIKSFSDNFGVEWVQKRPDEELKDCEEYIRNISILEKEFERLLKFRNRALNLIRKNCNGVLRHPQVQEPMRNEDSEVSSDYFNQLMESYEYVVSKECEMRIGRNALQNLENSKRLWISYCLGLDFLVFGKMTSGKTEFILKLIFEIFGNFDQMTSVFVTDNNVLFQLEDDSNDFSFVTKLRPPPVFMVDSWKISVLEEIVNSKSRVVGLSYHGLVSMYNILSSQDKKYEKKKMLIRDVFGNIDLLVLDEISSITSSKGMKKKKSKYSLYYILILIINFFQTSRIPDLKDDMTKAEKIRVFGEIEKKLSQEGTKFPKIAVTGTPYSPINDSLLNILNIFQTCGSTEHEKEETVKAIQFLRKENRKGLIYNEKATECVSKINKYFDSLVNIVVVSSKNIERYRDEDIIVIRLNPSNVQKQWYVEYLKNREEEGGDDIESAEFLRTSINSHRFFSDPNIRITKEKLDKDEVDITENPKGLLTCILASCMKRTNGIMVVTSKHVSVLENLEKHIRNFWKFKVVGQHVDPILVVVTGKSGTARKREKFLKLVKESKRVQPIILLVITQLITFGWNLNNVDVCIKYDPEWNPANEDQFWARFPRIGRKAHFLGIQLIFEDTVEEKMFMLMQELRYLYDQIIFKERSCLPNLCPPSHYDLLNVLVRKEIGMDIMNSQIRANQGLAEMKIQHVDKDEFKLWDKFLEEYFSSYIKFSEIDFEKKTATIDWEENVCEISCNNLDDDDTLQIYCSNDEGGTINTILSVTKSSSDFFSNIIGNNFGNGICHIEVKFDFELIVNVVLAISRLHGDVYIHGLTFEKIMKCLLYMYEVEKRPRVISSIICWFCERKIFFDDLDQCSEVNNEVMMKPKLWKECPTFLLDLVRKSCRMMLRNDEFSLMIKGSVVADTSVSEETEVPSDTSVTTNDYDSTQMNSQKRSRGDCNNGFPQIKRRKR